jgi:hypothetical protein
MRPIWLGGDRYLNARTICNFHYKSYLHFYLSIWCLPLFMQMSIYFYIRFLKVIFTQTIFILFASLLTPTAASI